ncbi:unnamed protein product [Rhizophagus irregularis]|nr:unnamed protein product [Rhizophagus irregularis]
MDIWKIMAHIKFRYGLDNSRSFSVPLAKAILGLPVKKMDVILRALRLSHFRLLGYEKIELKTLFKGAHFFHTIPNVKVALPDVEDIKLYKLNHRYPVSNPTRKTQ